MALHGSASANLSPILFKGNNRALGVNVIIHQDESGSMNDLIQFYDNGTFIGSLQEALLSKKIGDDLERYPNIYAYFGVYSRNPSTGFSITNPNGSLTISQAFMRGESSGSATIAKWTGSNYFSNSSSHVVNICTNVVGSITGGRLSGYGSNVNRRGVSEYSQSEDVHGSLWSIWTTPNAISTGIAGRYGSVIGSNVRAGSTTIIITNSDEQEASPAPMIDQLVTVPGPESIIENFPGLIAKRYPGYFGDSSAPDNNPILDNVNYADNLTPVGDPIYLTEINKFFAGTDISYNNTTWTITGTFLAPTTGTYTFFTNSDDASYLWIGDNALSGYTKDNAVVKNGGKHIVTEISGSINLVAGTYYPIRAIYGNHNLPTGFNPTELTISFSGPGITKRTDGNGYFFSTFTSNQQEKTINGSTGEMIFRKYRVISLSSYTSLDGYDGILFYGSTSSQPYGYVKFTSSTSYTITRSSSLANWTPSSTQLHNTLILASETRGGLFKIRNVFTNTGIDYRVAFSKCIAEFIADTV